MSRAGGAGNFFALGVFDWGICFWYTYTVRVLHEGQNTREGHAHTFFENVLMLWAMLPFRQHHNVESWMDGFRAWSQSFFLVERAVDFPFRP
jgi:hypothetical protein